MNFARSLSECVVSATNQFGVRSSKRTDVIHGCIRTHVEAQNPRVYCKVEYKLQTQLGGFDVDIAVFERETEKLLACVLFKGLTSSIAKNDKNYEHNKIGEAVKAKSGMTDAKLVYIDVVPVRCPTFGSGDVIKAWETHEPEKTRARSQLLMSTVNAGRVAPIIDDIYTVSVNYSYESSRQIQLVDVVDYTDLVRFDVFIDGLAPVGAPLL